MRIALSIVVLLGTGAAMEQEPPSAGFSSAIECGQADLASTAVELALLGDAFERLPGTLDAVLIVLAVRRQQLDDLVTAVGGNASHGAGGEVDGLPDREFVRLQSYSPVLANPRLRRPETIYECSFIEGILADAAAVCWKK